MPTCLYYLIHSPILSLKSTQSHSCACTHPDTSSAHLLPRVLHLPLPLLCPRGSTVLVPHSFSPPETSRQKYILSTRKPSSCFILFSGLPPPPQSFLLGNRCGESHRQTAAQLSATCSSHSPYFFHSAHPIITSHCPSPTLANISDLSPLLPNQSALNHSNMDWVAHREDATDSILRDLHRPSSANHVSEFSPLVNGMLTNHVAHQVAPDCSIPQDTRSARAEFEYEYSLDANPEFDTDSPDPRHDRNTSHEDDTSTHLRAPATSEDTSADDAVHANISVIDRHQDASSPLTVSGDSATRTNTVAVPKKEEFIDGNTLTNHAEEKSLAKPTKGISKKKTVGKKLSPIANATTLSMSAGTSAINGAPSHTKMCRDRLNNKFEKLRNTLPVAPTGVEVKHKAQLLDYAIAVIRRMVDTTARLEIELAVSSNKATMEWTTKLVNEVDSLEDAACEVMRLFARRRGWKHAELWLASKGKGMRDGTGQQDVVLTFGRCVRSHNIGSRHDSLEEFSKESEAYTFRDKEGVPGRVWSSMRPEWVSGLSDLKNFRRASLARKYGLKVCLALPVTITGKIEAVLCFYDTEHRPYDTQCLELGMRLAWALGNAIGGKRASGKVCVSGNKSTLNTT